MAELVLTFPVPDHVYKVLQELHVLLQMLLSECNKHDKTLVLRAGRIIVEIHDRQLYKHCIRYPKVTPWSEFCSRCLPHWTLGMYRHYSMCDGIRTLVLLTDIISHWRVQYGLQLVDPPLVPNWGRRYGFKIAHLHWNDKSQFLKLWQELTAFGPYSGDAKKQWNDLLDKWFRDYPGLFLHRSKFAKEVARLQSVVDSFISDDIK